MRRIGNCVGCHTAQGGRPFAGGRPLETPFGTVFATNITPDPETGIGLWSRKAFARALRDGVARSGDLLYPAFPYDHFTHASDADIDALYAFLMTRPAVQARAPANRLKEPFGFRPLLAGWNLLFLHKGPLADDPGPVGRVEPRPRPGRGTGALRRLPHAAQRARRREERPRLRRRLDGGLVCAAAQCQFARGTTMDCRCPLRLPAHRSQRDPCRRSGTDGQRHARAGASL